jgi:hypothetical protein
MNATGPRFAVAALLAGAIAAAATLLSLAEGVRPFNLSVCRRGSGERGNC